MISTASTEKFIDIETIKEDCVILKDGSLRAVLMVSGVNFDLLSETEQEIVLNAYQSLLNSLDFPLQILVHSRKINLDNYLNKIKELEKNEKNELLKLQIQEYYNFIDELVKSTNIMTKRFYVVVPYSPSLISATSSANPLTQIFQKLPLPFGKQKSSVPQQEVDKETQFVNNKMQLYHRVAAVISALKAMGLNAIRLKTPELIELYYNFYNPEKQERVGLAITAELEQLEEPTIE
ncbi:MAG: TraC family protein [Patescibacteria group bacterium]